MKSTVKNERVTYYSDPLTDDFAGTNINTCHVPADFKYVRTGAVWRISGFIVYYMIAVPLVWVMAKLMLGLKFENRKALKTLRKTGFFLYGNHTNALDVYVPALAAFPKRSYIIANPDIVSIRGIKRLVMMLGALPVPSEHKGMRGFTEAISLRCKERSCIAVYPEAHIWPYYTGIRPFADTSFYYPVSNGAPAVAMVTTYRKRKGLFAFCKRPGMTVTFSEVFYPDTSLTKREAQKKLHRQVYEFMKTKSENTDQVCYIRYEYKEKHEKPGA